MHSSLLHTFSTASFHFRFLIPAFRNCPSASPWLVLCREKKWPPRDVCLPSSQCVSACQSDLWSAFGSKQAQGWQERLGVSSPLPTQPSVHGSQSSGIRGVRMKLPNGRSDGHCPRPASGPPIPQRQGPPGLVLLHHSCPFPALHSLPVLLSWPLDD